MLGDSCLMIHNTTYFRHERHNSKLETPKKIIVPQQKYLSFLQIDVK